jgi:hypothetical protein
VSGTFCVSLSEWFLTPLLSPFLSPTPGPTIPTPYIYTLPLTNMGSGLGPVCGMREW